MSLSFTSLEYLLFLGACLILVGRMQRISAQKWLLIIFSYLFLLSFGVAGVVVMTLTALADFYLGQQLGASRSVQARKRWLWAGVATNLAPLVVLKYSVFLADSANGVLHRLGIHSSVPEGPSVAIIGFSYFTFSGMSYILDIYYESIEPTQSISEFVCYLFYFPKLVAGPIVRAVDLLPQFRSRLRLSPEDIEIGCAYLLVGAVKKLAIADLLAGHVGMILAAPQEYNAFTLLQGMIGYTVQIYADFSGYSDMAIGCARLMGIRFPQNFLMPYSSVNIVEFWRRWHVTMSTWFRDYLFLPLEMASRDMRHTNVRVARNMIITMLFCGLWHGASWNFVLWGGSHGVALAAYLVYARRVRRRALEGTRLAFYLRQFAARALTLSVVMVGWIMFGTNTLTGAFNYLWRMLSWAKDGVALGSPYIVPLTALIFLVHLFINKDRNLVEELPTYSMPARVFAYSCLLLALTAVVRSDAVPFVYVSF